MKKIILVNVPFLQESTYSIAYYKNPYPNLSLSYLAGFLEGQMIQVNVIDGKFSRMGLGDLMAALKELQPEIIGFTSMTTEIFDVTGVIRQVKAEFSHALTVLGGVHASALPGEVMETIEAVDVAAVGEGEEILLELAKGLPLEQINSIYYRENGEVKRTPARPPGKLDGYGSAAFHLWGTAPFYYVSTYRGCPFHCSFCFKVLGDRIRLRQPEDVLKDIEFAASQKAVLDICDATFGLIRKHTVTILEGIIERGIKVSWSAATRVDIADESLLTLMKQAGCITIAFGIESGSDEVLKKTQKGIAVKDIQKIVKTAKRIGLSVTGYYVFGHPNETKSDVLKTSRMIRKLNTTQSIIGIMTPWPGTSVYDLASRSEDGYTLLHKRYNEYDKHYGSALKFHNFSMRWLEMMRAYSYLNLYISNFRFIDLFRFFWIRRKNIFKKLRSLVTGLFKKMKWKPEQKP